ncbi:unnamed protein product [Lactuca saligna]|uniref:Uncharacterized protein n=1 Tax=Lactuca saligna TaxID=75948 RepID=A0AA36A5H8_LACSI|nr:unnamed protein product [Lactuca saligna]
MVIYGLIILFSILLIILFSILLRRVFHSGKPWPLVGRKFYIAFSFFRGASILACAHNSEDDSMDDIDEIQILLEWNHEFQLCWNGITNSNSIEIT